MTTVLAYDFRFAQRAYKTSARCLLAILLYNCNPSPGPGEPSPTPESPKSHTTPTQKENADVAQRNATVSAPPQPAAAHEVLNTLDSIEPPSYGEQAGGHDGVASSQGQNLEETAQNNDDHTSTQHSEPNLDPQEILNTKFQSPDVELTLNQSISLVNHCATLGEHNAAQAANKEVVMALGNTGAGKSTTVNCLMGCKMQTALDEFEEEIIIVDPESIRPEVMSIGHGDTSHTFMPKIVSDSDHDNRAYCDCPGFADNRGAEINIANAINTRRVLQQAGGVRAVFLAEYSDFIGSRGDNIQAMESMCLQMFGSVENLRRHQNAVLFGITKAPLCNGIGQPISLNVIRLRITQANTPTAQILANRVFLFDPLDRGRDNPDFWSIARCRTEIAKLSSIPQREATTLFQTVLTGDDQTKLKHIMRAQADALVASLERDDYQAAGSHWQSLTRLRVIGNEEVEQMIGELAGIPLLNFMQKRVIACTEHAAHHRFDEAGRQLAHLKTLLSHIPNTSLQVSLAALESLLTQCKETKAEEQRNTDKKLAAAKQKAVQEVRKEMEQMKEQLMEQMMEQLGNELQQMNLSESERQAIRTKADEAGKEILERIAKN
jgi:flagellar biosynthesis GTPase FlhF